MIRSARWSAPLVIVGLVVAILSTRVNHFGDAVSLPDATLAAFFLAGLWVRPFWPFVALLAAAGLADQWAFRQGMSDWCVTPAYPFLVPTYACLWFAGRVSRNLDGVSLAGAARLAANLFAATAVAFAVSNGSFFLVSGYFQGMSGLEYWRATARYFPLYAGWAFAYVTLTLGAALLLRRTTRAARFDPGR